MQITVPDIGDFSDVPVIEIHVRPGETVAAEDPLLTLESDKATMDVPAPVGGRVEKLLVAVGDRVAEGSPLLELTPAGASPASEPPAPGGRADHHAPLVVLGGGPGGYTAAFRAADLGVETILIERYERLGGVCLNVGCIPSKALLHAARVVAEAEEMSAHGLNFGAPQIDLDALRAYKQGAVDRLTGGLDALARQRKVRVLRGTARFTGAHELILDGGVTVSFEHCIIAAGSESVTLPGWPEDARVMDSTRALELPFIPDRLLVVGGGIIGLELATVFDALGSRVSVVELAGALLPGCDPDLVRPLQKRIAGRYEEILLGTRVAGVEAGEDALQVELLSERDGTRQLKFDAALVAVGRRPNGHALGAEAAGVPVDARGFIVVDEHLRTGAAHILAIGDVSGEPMLAHRATHQAKVAAETVAGQNVIFDPRTVPSVAYTDPEVAWMGLTETVAAQRGVDYEKAVFPWAASGRAIGIGRTEGHTKLLLEPGSRRLLGAGIVGPGAGELIAELVHALEMGSSAEDLALSIHPHPTLSETVGLAAELAEGTITDLMPKRS